MKKDNNLLDVEQMRQLEEYYNRAGVEINKYKDQQVQYDPKSGKMQGFSIVAREEKPINANIQQQNPAI